MVILKVFAGVKGNFAQFAAKTSELTTISATSAADSRFDLENQAAIVSDNTHAGLNIAAEWCIINIRPRDMWL